MPGSTPGPIIGIRRRMPFAGGPGRYFLTPSKSSSASFILTPASTRSVAHSVVGVASFTLTATAIQNIEDVVVATASITLQPLAVSNRLIRPFVRSSIILVPTADEIAEFVASSTATIVLATVASTSHAATVVASASLILSAASTRSNLSHINASASLILSASASETATFDNFLLSTPLAVIFLSASASETRAANASATVGMDLLHFSAAAGGTRIGHAFATAFLILRARSRYPTPKAAVVEDYLGRFQQGAEVPLSIQCFASAETPGLPDNAPIVRMYRVVPGSVDCLWERGLKLALQPDTQVVGRFGASHPLGARDAPGRYVAAYWYTAGGVPQSQCQVFEVVPGGDPGGPVIAAQVISRPDGDRVLAELGAGMLALGQDPYLDGA